MPRPPGAGFTLVEILVAMTIFAVVAALAFGALRFVAREQEALARAADLETAAARCLERMAEDLSAVYVAQPPLFSPPLPGDPPSEGRLSTGPDAGEGQLLTFASLAHVPLEGPPRRGLARIGYRLETAAEGGYRILRSDHLLPEGESQGRGLEPVLCENVKSAAFDFYGWNGDIDRDWDSDADRAGYASPRGVRIALTLAADGHERTFQTTVYLSVQREPWVSEGQQP